MMDRPYHDREWLREQYVVQQRPITHMAAECGISDTTMGRYLRKAGITTRGRDMTAARAVSVPNAQKRHAERVEFLREHYGRIPALQIAMALDMTFHGVCALASEMGLRSEQPRNKGRKLARQVRLAQYRALWARGLTVREISAELGISASTCAEYRNELGLPSRSGWNQYASKRIPPQSIPGVRVHSMGEW